METGTTLSHMAQYNFNTPINVTMIFEDSDEESSHKNIKTEKIIKEELISECTNDQKKTEAENSDCNSAKINISSKEDFRSEISLHIEGNEICSIDKITEITNNHNITPEAVPNVTVDEENSSVIDNGIQTPGKIISQDISEIYQHINEKQELTTYVKDLLKTLSEHLILIMRAYYHYYQTNPSALMSNGVLTQLSKLKVHFFDLSYSTVVSLILPQENNEEFIRNFIDKTVADANKVLNWKCGRHHIEPFFNEMVEWTRLKKTRIRNMNLPHLFNKKATDDNRILKEKLSNPALLPSITQPLGANSSTANTYNRRSSDTENTTCIFASGSPGREISINVDQNTLQRQYSSQHNSSVQQTPTKRRRSGKRATAQSGQAYNNKNIQNLQQNMQSYTVHHTPVQPQVPPPYYGPLHLVTPTMPHTMPNSMTQVQQNIQAAQNYHRNINQYAAASFNNPNSELRYNPQNEGQFAPVITSVTSLNPTSNPMIGKCCICGKVTNTRCSKCNSFSYCSYLCQELDAGTHQSSCGQSN